MTTAAALAKHINSALASPIIPNKLDSQAESLVIMLQTNTVRILLVRNHNTPSYFSIEVEVFLPGKDEASTKLTDSQLLDDVIRNLQYLQGLRDAGFSIEAIGADCMWSAFKDFRKCPEEEVLGLLIPPHI
jgi:hypothetical protein